MEINPLLREAARKMGEWSRAGAPKDEDGNPLPIKRQMKLNQIKCLAGEQDTELNIALCELAGYYYDDLGFVRTPEGHYQQNQRNCHNLYPDYLSPITGLNLIHKLEKTLGARDNGGWRLISSYMANLWKVVQDPHICPTSHAFDYINAPARQRGVALLLTLKPDIFECES